MATAKFKISDLTDITSSGGSIDPDNDFIIINDADGPETKKVSVSNLVSAFGNDTTINGNITINGPGIDDSDPAIDVNNGRIESQSFVCTSQGGSDASTMTMEGFVFGPPEVAQDTGMYTGGNDRISLRVGRAQNVQSPSQAGGVYDDTGRVNVVEAIGIHSKNVNNQSWQELDATACSLRIGVLNTNPEKLLHISHGRLALSGQNIGDLLPAYVGSTRTLTPGVGIRVDYLSKTALPGSANSGLQGSEMDVVPLVVNADGDIQRGGHTDRTASNMFVCVSQDVADGDAETATGEGFVFGTPEVGEDTGLYTGGNDRLSLRAGRAYNMITPSDAGGVYDDTDRTYIAEAVGIFSKNIDNQPFQSATNSGGGSATATSVRIGVLNALPEKAIHIDYGKRSDGTDFGASPDDCEIRVRYLSGTGTQDLQVNENGDILRNTSDARLKENVATLEDATEMVKALNPVRYDWKEEADRNGSDIGFIAQEVEEILPELVSTGDNDMKGIRYGNMVAVLTSSLQSALARIEALEAEVESLKG